MTTNILIDIVIIAINNYQNIMPKKKSNYNNSGKKKK